MAQGAREHDLEDRLIRFAIVAMDVAETLPNTRSGNHVAGQLVRSGTSPAPNYAEAQGAESRKDFVHKLKLALKELQESRVWIRIIVHKPLLAELRDVREALSECDQLIRILSKSVATAQSAKPERGG